MAKALNVGSLYFRFTGTFPQCLNNLVLSERNYGNREGEEGNRKITNEERHKIGYTQITK